MTIRVILGNKTWAANASMDETSQLRCDGSPVPTTFGGARCLPDPITGDVFVVLPPMQPAAIRLIDG